MILTQTEIKIIEILREAKPFEHVDISKDNNGTIDSYIVHRSQKIILKKEPKEKIY
jgi:hypothetical protein